MFKIQDICAVIVSYNDAEALYDNISSLINQVGRILIIDNASDENCRRKLKQIVENFHVSIKYDVKNKGIAYQLNRGLSFCKEQGYSLMLSMDQDSRLRDNCVREMLEVLNNSEDDIVSVGPNREYPKWSKKVVFKEKKYLITSGNLFEVDKAIDCGGFFDALFIDMVDIDFSLALRSRGYRVVLASKAQMDHEVGVKEIHRIMFWNYSYLSHSPERFYYIYRNRGIVCRKYLKKFPIYCVKIWVNLLICTFFIFLEKDALRKIKFALNGVIDGLRFSLVVND